ncbi:MAG: hypothetical protein Q9218_002638, partial [Villophora microphyllina]
MIFVPENVKKTAKVVDVDSQNLNAMNYERRIGYYELFNVHERLCDKIFPEDLEVAPLTHINLAFVLFGPDFKLIDTDGELISRVTFLKSRYQGLRVNVAIGGWAFNDPPTQSLFSDMATSEVNRQIFVKSLTDFLTKYNLDGVDIDWEYPAAPDRGGKVDDTEGYVLLMSDIRDAFDQINPAWEATVTVPTSYWYLRGFDVTSLQDYVDWFNVMSYDLHGMWDQHNKFTGPYLEGHTNITEIEQGLDLLWRNGIGPNKVVLGFAFYGRSFTMSDPGCSKPGCTFSTSGIKGDCTNTGGILSYSELSSRNKSLDVHTFYDPKSTVKYNVYNGNQWISYDDQESFTDKKRYLTSRCLGGLMIWAIDQDTQNHDALEGLLGDFSDSQLEGGNLDPKTAAALSDAFGAYTGQNCFVTPTCTDGSDAQKQNEQVCPAGSMAVSTAHAPLQAAGKERHGDCDEGPANPLDPVECDHADDEFQTYRFDQDNGDFCSAAYRSPVDGSIGSPLTDRFKRAFCCPKGKGYNKCNWSNSPTADQLTSSPSTPQAFGDVENYCQPQPCGKGQTRVTQALKPPTSGFIAPDQEGGSCDGFSIPAGFSQEFPYCCDPPSKYSDKWPVDPKYLFEHYYDTPQDDVMWNYDDEYRNNNQDKSQDNPGDEDGKDAYGFIMLDGPPGSLDNDFPKSHTITRRTAHIPKTKRSLLTSNSTLIDATFDHAEEIVYVYCNFPQDSPECQKVWHKGAEDTIIRLPAHVGEGPFARIVSMEKAEAEYRMPVHHVEARSLEGNTNQVYKLRFDYAFHLIKRDDPGYWDNLTDEPASKKKRDVYAQHLSEREWRDRIGKAKKKHAKLRKRKEAKSYGTSTTDMGDEYKPLKKRWFGKFLDWLSRLNSVESQDVGFLSMALKKSILLFKAAYGCPGQTVSASMKMYLDTDVEMEATYAYYFSGTIVPPAVTGTYAYFSLEPSAYLGLRLTGNARLQATTGRKKLLDTISYPGLAIKGIAAVGPTLDLYGEIAGVVQIKGEMRAGARLNFGKAEVYWPQDDAANDKYQKLLGLKDETTHPSQDLIVPTFDAKVQVDAQIDIKVTPEANMGLRVGGFVNTSLSFQANFTGKISSKSGPENSYHYGVYLLYNLGYGAFATIKFFPNWALKPRNAYNPPKRFTIYENSGSFAALSKRTIDAPTVPAPKFPRRGLVTDWHGAEISPVDGVRASHGYGDVIDLGHNQSSSMSLQSLLGKRADGDSDTTMDSQPSGDFTSQLTCPPGDTADIKLPDYR